MAQVRADLRDPADDAHDPGPDDGHPEDGRADAAGEAEALSVAPLTIGEVASRYDVTLRTLRFYETKGLLAPERRGTARFYDATQIARLEAVLERRRLGFVLPAIAEMIARHGVPLPRLTRAEIDAQIAHLEAQHAIIVAAIADLQAMLPDDQ